MEALSAGIPGVRAARSAAVARGKVSGDILAFDAVVTRGKVMGEDGLASVAEGCGALGPAVALEEVEAEEGEEVEADNKEIFRAGAECAVLARGCKVPGVEGAVV